MLLILLPPKKKKLPLLAIVLNQTNKEKSIIKEDNEKTINLFCENKIKLKFPKFKLKNLNELRQFFIKSDLSFLIK